MRLLYLLSFLLLGCANVNTPTYEPINNEEYIEQYEAQSDQEIKATTLQVYTYTGVALFVAGVGMVAFTPRLRSGLVVLLGGLLAMGTPFIFNTKWFGWILGVAFCVSLFYGLYVIYRLTIKYVEEKRAKSNGKQD